MSSTPLDPALERSFRGHKDAITSVAFNPNMKQLVSGGADGCVMVWNFKLQLRAFRFVGHKEAVTSVACAPIAAAPDEGRVRLNIPFEELRQLAVIGTGTFGRVKLVQHVESARVAACQRFAATLRGEQRGSAGPPVGSGEAGRMLLGDLGDEDALKCSEDWVNAIVSDAGICPFSLSADRAGLPLGRPAVLRAAALAPRPGFKVRAQGAGPARLGTGPGGAQRPAAQGPAGGQAA